MEGLKEVERVELKNTFSIKGTHLFSTKKKMDLVREGLKKVVNYTLGSGPPPRSGKKIKHFFLKLDYFLSTFCKKCIF